MTIRKDAKAFSQNLTKLFKAYDFETVAKDIREQFIEAAGVSALASAKSEAPELTGALKNAIYKEMSSTEYKTMVKIAIPFSIPYAYAVVFGDKRHLKNPFMEVAGDEGMRSARKMFKKISRDALIKMNNTARGKL